MLEINHFVSTALSLLAVKVVLQSTLLMLALLLLARVFKLYPAIRYTLLYSTIMSLPLILVLAPIAHYSGFTAVSVPLPAFFDTKDFVQSQFVVETSIDLELDTSDLLQNNQGEAALAAPTFPTDHSGAKSLTALLLVSFWLIGVLFCLSRLQISHRKISRLRRSARELTPSEITQITSVCNLLRKSSGFAAFKISNEVFSPVVVGHFDPVIILPAKFLPTLSPMQLNSILIHEFAHIERSDFAANIVQRLIVCLYWFHPLVWKLDKEITRAREEVCDNYVLAQSSAIDFGEALLSVGGNTLKTNNLLARQQDFSLLAVGVIDTEWKLEDRIAGLLNLKRERSMTLSSSKTLALQASAFVVTVLLAGCQIATEPKSNEIAINQSAEGSEVLENTVGNEADQRARFIQTQSQTQSQTQAATESREPPQARTADSLSDDVMNKLNSIQLLLNPADENSEPNFSGAKVLLDELTIERYDSLNSFEQASSLNFLTNYYLTQEDYENAAETFKRLLTIEPLRADIRLRALRALGQLTSALESWNESTDYYEQWRTLSVAEDEVIFRGLSYAHYQLEEYDAAIEFWESYMEIQQANEIEISRDDYAYLSGMFYTNEDLDRALDLTKTMILLFNNPVDWENLRSLYAMLDAQDQADDAIEELLGEMDESTESPAIAQASVTPADGDYLPLIGVAPQYPTQAAQDGIEGWALVEFTVLPDGTVDEDSVVVKDADPVNVFDRTSLRAARQFEFMPRVIDGQAEAVAGVQYVFRFVLDSEV